MRLPVCFPDHQTPSGKFSGPLWAEAILGHEMYMRITNRSGPEDMTLQLFLL